MRSELVSVTIRMPSELRERLEAAGRVRKPTGRPDIAGAAIAALDAGLPPAPKPAPKPKSKSKSNGLARIADRHARRREGAR